MKGCLLRLAILPLIGVATYVLLSIRAPFPTFVFPAPGAEVAAPVASFFFWFAVLFLMDARLASASLALAQEAATRGLRGGARAVVYGSLEARGELLEAPFSGESCLGYHYEVYHRNPRMNGDQIDYEGYALAPSAVRGPAGSLAILAPADKELFYEVPFVSLDGDEAFAHAEGYLAATDFGAPGGLFGDVRRREIVEGPGSFRTDVSSGTRRELRTCRLRQRVLRPGDEIGLAGVYSEPERGIGPDADSILRPFHLVPGGEAALARKIRGKRKGAAVCAALGLTAVAVYLLVAPGLS